jgi:hypothetical protein
MELNFDDIVSGKDPKQVQQNQSAQDTKLKQTETRARQQSCMIHEIDKDLVLFLLLSFLPTRKLRSKTLESAYRICCALYV